MAFPTRRAILGQLGAVALAPALDTFAWAARPQAASQAQIYDVVIAGGRVIDPSQRLSAVSDVAIADGRIARVAEGIPREQARQVVDAAGTLVVPGLIDVHGHVYDRGIPSSIDPDLIGIPRGVTTIVDGGSTGASTFAGFRAYVVERARTRVYALLNISTIGLAVTNELYLDPAMINPKAAIAVIQDNRDVILGIKVRITGRDADVPHDLDVLTKAREAAEATGLPIVMHWTNDRRLLARLVKGDVLAHPFNPARSGPSLLGADGRVLPQILELKDRGIFTDFAHGNHLLWETAEQAARQGWYPDAISTDIHRGHVAPSGVVHDLVSTMGKFLYLGLSIEQVIERVTASPTRMYRFPERIGTLQEGAVADVSVLAVERGAFPVYDSTRQVRTATERLVPVTTIKSGVVARA